jgi:prepilin peptidase CpaA
MKSRGSKMGALNIKYHYNYAFGIFAIILSFFFIFIERENFSILAASLFFLIICITDTLASRIPNIITLSATLAGVGYHTWTAGTSGLLFSFYGILTGLTLLLIPYLMGGMGAGDVKALSALGSLLGAGATCQVFIYAAIAGGILGVFHYALAHNLKEKFLKGARNLRTFAYTRDVELIKPSTSEQLRFPYASAIAFGFYAFVSWGGIV